MRDPVIKQVVEKFQERSAVGYKKYGVTLHDDEPSLHKWLNHLQEELMDAVNYIQKLKMETSDALEEKLLKDYQEQPSAEEMIARSDARKVSKHPEPGPPGHIGIKSDFYPGGIEVSYTIQNPEPYDKPIQER